MMIKCPCKSILQAVTVLVSRILEFTEPSKSLSKIVEPYLFQTVAECSNLGIVASEWDN
jgi:hypothetical protein